MNKMLLALTHALFASGMLHAQTIPMPALPPGLPHAESMMQAMQAAQAAAARPGDDALTCDLLEAEIAAIGTDPQVQAVIQEQGAYAQGQMAKVHGGQQQAEAEKAAQGAKAAVETQQNLLDKMVNAQEVTSILPQMMRVAHVVQLAQAKGCAFLSRQMTPGQ